jgi:hypothetical protein
MCIRDRGDFAGHHRRRSPIGPMGAEADERRLCALCATSARSLVSHWAHRNRHRAVGGGSIPVSTTVQATSSALPSRPSGPSARMVARLASSHRKTTLVPHTRRNRSSRSENAVSAQSHTVEQVLPPKRTRTASATDSTCRRKTSCFVVTYTSSLEAAVGEGLDISAWSSPTVPRQAELTTPTPSELLSRALLIRLRQRGRLFEGITDITVQYATID